MERDVRHCIFKWNIQGLAFSDENINKVIASPVFEVGNRITKFWTVHCYPNGVRKNKSGFSYYLHCLQGIDPAIVTAHCTFLWKDAENCNCFHLPTEIEIEDAYSGFEHMTVIEFESILKDIEGETPLYDSISLDCEIYQFISREKSLSVSKTDLDADACIYSLSEDMRKFYELEWQTDLEIKLKDGQTTAHKAILCSRSAWFEEMLKDDSLTSMELPDVKLEVMTKLLQFVYTGDLEEILIDDYSPFKLYELAKRFRIYEIIEHFSPEIYLATTTIATRECNLTWDIKNFRSYCETSTEHPVSPFFKYNTTSAKWRMQISFEENEFIAIMVERLDECEIALQVLLTISLLGSDGEKMHTKRKWGRVKKKEIFGFHSFIARKDLGVLLVKDVLTVKGTLRHSTGELSVRLDTKGADCEIDYSNSNSVSKDFELLLKSGIYSDSILVAGGKKFKAHRIMLAARSPVFAGMFQHGMLEQESGEIIINDVESEVIEILLHYIYTGKVDEGLFSQFALLIYCAADKYALNFLKEKCSQFLRSHLCDELVCEALIAADMRGDSELKAAAELYVCNNAGRVVLQKDWQDVIPHCTSATSDILKGISLEF